MKWEGLIRKLEEATQSIGTEPDPFEQLGRSSNNPLLAPTASVSSTFKRAMPYSELVVSFTVTINCPQGERFLDIAGQLAYEKARELANDGYCAIVTDAPRLGE